MAELPRQDATELPLLDAADIARGAAIYATSVQPEDCGIAAGAIALGLPLSALHATANPNLAVIIGVGIGVCAVRARLADLGIGARDEGGLVWDGTIEGALGGERQQSTADRWAAFAHDERVELMISLDHRRAEALAGNAYVDTENVVRMLGEVEASVTTA